MKSYLLCITKLNKSTLHFKVKEYKFSKYYVKTLIYRDII
jgi:hypothetical protein